MVGQKFSQSWNSSIKPRKQHKYRYNAPLHVRQKLLRAHLSPDLRKKYGFRSLQLKKGDKIKVMRGQFIDKEGKIDSISLRYERVLVSGIDTIKKDGTKIPFPLSPSNLMILELELADKYRKQKLESKVGKVRKELNAHHSEHSIQKDHEVENKNEKESNKIKN